MKIPFKRIDWIICIAIGFMLGAYIVWAADSKISGLTELASGGIADTDIFVLVDADASTTKKHLWSSVKAEIKTYGDTLYQPLDTDLNNLATPTAWRMFYSDGADPFIQEITLGADGTFLESNGPAPPAFRALAAGDIPDISATYEVQLNNEAGLYGVLSDVTNFLQDNEKFTGQVTVQAFGADDATPDVSNAALGVNNVYQTANANATTITDFDDGDDHSEFADGDWFILRVDDANTTIDFSANANIEGNAGVDFTGSATQIVYLLFIYEDARWNCVNFTQGYSDPTTLAISSVNIGSGALEVPNDESADKTLSNLGEIHIRGDEDTLNAHVGAGGEIAGEVQTSWVQHVAIPIDFTYVYDRDTSHRLPLFVVSSKVYPNGIIIDYWSVKQVKARTTALDADLKRATDFQGTSVAVIDAIDIGAASSSSSEDTDANINGGAVIAAGQHIYIEVSADPVDEDNLATVEILFHSESD